MKKVMMLIAGLFFMASNLYAGSGDLIVNGNLGVGTTSPQSKLHVGDGTSQSGTIRLQGNSTSGSYATIRHEGDNFMIDNSYSSGTEFFIQYNGNVGIGTTSPGAKLHISSNNAIIDLQNSNLPMSDTNFAAYLRFKDSLGTQVGYVGDGGGGQNITLSGETGYNLTLGAGGFQRMWIDAATGNVGIGTTSPGANIKLDIQAPAAAARIKSTTGTNAVSLRVNNTGGDFFIARESSTGNTTFTGAEAYESVVYSEGAYPLGIYTNGIRRIYLASTGYVGIGTPNPTQPLYVAGNIYATGTITGPSDVKFKKNIQPLGAALNTVTRLHGVSYNWRTDEYKDKGFSKGRHYGVIAQEVEKVLPEVVQTDSNGDKAVAYTELIPVLIEAVKEQQKQIESQKAEIATLKAQQAMVSTLMEKVSALEKQVGLRSTVALADK